MTESLFSRKMKLLEKLGNVRSGSFVLQNGQLCFFKNVSSNLLDPHENHKVEANSETTKRSDVVQDDLSPPEQKHSIGRKQTRICVDCTAITYLAQCEHF